MFEIRNKSVLSQLLGRGRLLGLGLAAFFGIASSEAVAQVFFGPSNDNLTNAWVLTGVTGTTNGDDFGATYELLEPSPWCFPTTNSVWFSWTAPTNGFATFDTFGSFFDTELAVYQNFSFLNTNVTFANLFLVGWNDDAPSPPATTNTTNSLVSFFANAGTTYYIQLVGYDYTQEGLYVLNWSLSNTLSFVLLSTNQIQFAFTNYTVDEAAGVATIDVIYNGGAANPVTVDYATSDGTAIGGFDYFSASGTLTFAVGETNKSFLILINDNAFPNSNATVNLTLSRPTGGASLGALTNAVLTIIDNEIVPFISEAGQFNFSALAYHVTDNEEITGGSIWNDSGNPSLTLGKFPGR